MNLYHYRGIESAISEIENHSFRMAAKAELNDPLEEYVSVYWCGDDAAYEGLLRNYICSLYNILSAFFVDPGINIVKEYPWLVALPDIHYLDNAPQGTHMHNVADRFLGRTEISAVVRYLSQYDKEQESYKRCNRETLLFGLHLLQGIAYKDCIDEMKNAGLLKNDYPDLYIDVSESIKALQAITENYDARKEAALTIAFNRLKDETFENIVIRLRNEHNGKNNLNSMENMLNIRADFPRIYVDRLREIIYPKSYVTCFSSEYNISSMWGNYADRHKGVCLIYETSSNNHINLGRLEDEQKKKEQTVNRESAMLLKVDYGGEVVNRNFFESLGRLTHSQVNVWLTGKNSNRSSCFHPNDFNKWRNKYWNDLNKICCTKMPSWSYEKEYRIMVNDFMYEVDGDICYCGYEKSQLDGVIFGLKTSLDDKIRLMEAVKNTFGNINDINWYQIEYDDRKRELRKHKYNPMRF